MGRIDTALERIDQSLGQHPSGGADGASMHPDLGGILHDLDTLIESLER